MMTTFAVLCSLFLAFVVVSSRPMVEDEDDLDSTLDTLVRHRSRRHIGERKAKLAQKHFAFVDKNYGCQQPLPRVVDVKDLYPSSSKQYQPHCTVLHRCGRDTGCCRNEEEHCVPKNAEEVTLFFNVVEIKPSGEIDHRVTSLTFSNHTECECKLLNDFPR